MMHMDTRSLLVGLPTRKHPTLISGIRRRLQQPAAPIQ